MSAVSAIIMCVPMKIIQTKGQTGIVGPKRHRHTHVPIIPIIILELAFSKANICIAVTAKFHKRCGGRLIALDAGEYANTGVMLRIHYSEI